MNKIDRKSKNRVEDLLKALSEISYLIDVKKEFTSKNLELRESIEQEIIEIASVKLSN